MTPMLHPELFPYFTLLGKKVCNKNQQNAYFLH